MEDQHFKRPVACRQCEWVGVSGELIAGGRSPELLCPKCGAGGIKYIISDAPQSVQ